LTLARKVTALLPFEFGKQVSKQESIKMPKIAEPDNK